MCARVSFIVAFVCFALISPSINAQSVETADVVVVGAGSAGVPAAIQAARTGAKTFLIESGSQLGGNATSGGVNFPGLFHAWGKQVIAGIGWEWVEKTVAVSGGAMPDFAVPTGRQHWKHQIRVNIPVYILIGEELCTNSGVCLRYYESPVSVEKVQNGGDANWKLTTSAMGEIRTIFCKQLVDCTGNGSLAVLAGAERMREEATQPGTFNYVIKHEIDLKTIDRKQIEEAYQQALRDGTLEQGDSRGGIISFLADSSTNYVYGADNSTAAKRTETNLRGRKAALRMLRFIQTLPGGESATIESMSAEVGVRETWRVLGEYVITRDDYVEGRKWEDSLAYAFYPIDLHENVAGVHPKHLEEGVVATIPMRALLVKNVPNLLAAGRCISSDRLANSALRVQATCMASGQAAGAIAGLAATQDVEPKDLDLEEIKETLRKADAIVP
ncbi:MAG: FAD-dependent oxidoreductase [Thermoguttaceae bacterium]|nr:FAD-dependent oxidoreductase [Thermoguttaceae bacterium]